MKKGLGDQRLYGLTLIAISCLFLSILFIYARITTLSADDYWYSTFLNDGITAWFQKMQEHYETLNGRTFVHLLATGILHFGKLLFAIVFALSFVITGRCLHADPKDMAAFFALFLGGTILTPRPIMVEGCLWISAFCNYIIPTMMTALLFGLSRRLSSRGGKSWGLALGALVLSFLCGATNEQSAVAVCALLVLLFIEAIVDHNYRYARTGAIQLVLAVLGAMSIFLSPATRLRMNNESYEPLAERIKAELLAQRNLFVDCPALVVLFAMLPILLFATCHQKKTKRIIALISILMVSCLLFTTLRDGGYGAYSYGAALFLLMLLATVCWFSKDRETGTLLCYADLTIIAMLLTKSSGYRSFAPAYVILLSIICNSVCEVLKSAPEAWQKKAKYSVVVLLVLLISIQVRQDFPHYYYNHQIETLNNTYVKQAQTSGVLYYCMDYDEAYTHSKAYYSGYFFDKFLMSIKPIAEPESIYLYGKDFPNIFVNGERLTSPALVDLAGNYVLPLRSVVEQSGGIVDWSAETGIAVIWNNVTYSLANTLHGYLVRWDTDDGTYSLEYVTELAHEYYKSMLPIDFFKDLLGMSVELSGSAITISSGNLS